ncbi:MAG: hypothetical protein L3J12_04405, partial [Spirochaetales bacterium]|nr:hypothetical protein [Spirochaetales bacterium]
GEDSIGRISEKMKLPAEQQKRLLCNVIDAHRIEISSTEIRMRIARGKEIRYLVPPSVEAYIEQYNLYQG